MNYQYDSSFYISEICMHKHMFANGNFNHMSEAINIINNYKVKKVIFNCGSYNNLEKEVIKVLDKKKIDKT